jgi:hypothetical protein
VSFSIGKLSQQLLISDGDSVCTGETPTGNDFETFFPNFDGVITEEFFNFLRAIFRRFLVFFGEVMES